MKDFRHQYREEERLLLRAASLLTFAVGLFILLSGACRKPTKIKKYLIILPNARVREIIESSKDAHQVIRTHYPDVLGKARATGEGLMFNSPSLGTIYINLLPD